MARAFPIPRRHRRISLEQLVRAAYAFLMRTTVVKRRYVSVNRNIRSKAGGEPWRCFFQQGRRSGKDCVLNGQARFVHSLPQCSLGRNRFQSKHLLKIVVFTKLLDPVKVWFRKHKSPVMVSSASAVLYSPLFLSGVTCETRSRKPDRSASIPIIAIPPWLVRNPSVSVIINFSALA